ncbi:hypothetical protein [Anaerocolumna cellulosilytica]|nr:hypothetical protein [Anaerocolumna cellulosilytica]MBB5197498.1 hypothetical protein [Anaerocolumna cellulosilytica]
MLDYVSLQQASEKWRISKEKNTDLTAHRKSQRMRKDIQTND